MGERLPRVGILRSGPRVVDVEATEMEVVDEEARARGLLCAFDSPCKTNKPTRDTKQDPRCRSESRLSNGRSSFSSRDTEHRHYPVYIRIARRSPPSPSERGRWDGVNGRILRCKFHSTRPPLPSLSLYLSFALSLLSLSLLPLPYRPTELPLRSQPFPPISFLLFPTSSFLYLRPPLSLKSSRRSPLFFFLLLFSDLALSLSFSCHRAPDRVITIASLGRTCFFAVRRDFYGAKEREKAAGRVLERTCRGCSGRRSRQRS